MKLQTQKQKPMNLPKTKKNTSKMKTFKEKLIFWHVLQRDNHALNTSFIYSFSNQSSRSFPLQRIRRQRVRIFVLFFFFMHRILRLQNASESLSHTQVQVHSHTAQSHTRILFQFFFDSNFHWNSLWHFHSIFV